MVWGGKTVYLENLEVSWSGEENISDLNLVHEEVFFVVWGGKTSRLLTWSLSLVLSLYIITNTDNKQILTIQQVSSVKPYLGLVVNEKNSSSERGKTRNRSDHLMTSLT